MPYKFKVWKDGKEAVLEIKDGGGHVVAKERAKSIMVARQQAITAAIKTKDLQLQYYITQTIFPEPD